MSNAEAIVLAILAGIVLHGLLFVWWSWGDPSYPPQNNHANDQPPD